MIVQFIDAIAGTTVYINPQYVVSMRPDPAHPDENTIVTLDGGETLTVRGEHMAVADKLRRAAA